MIAEPVAVTRITLRPVPRWPYWIMELVAAVVPPPTGYTRAERFIQVVLGMN